MATILRKLLVAITRPISRGSLRCWSMAFRGTTTSPPKKPMSVRAVAAAANDSVQPERTIAKSPMPTAAHAVRTPTHRSSSFNTCLHQTRPCERQERAQEPQVLLPDAEQDASGRGAGHDGDEGAHLEQAIGARQIAHGQEFGEDAVFGGLKKAACRANRNSTAYDTSSRFVVRATDASPAATISNDLVTTRTVRLLWMSAI